MKKLFFFLAVLSFYTASSQWYVEMSDICKYSIRNLDGRDYRVVDMGSTTYLFRTTTWEADTSMTNIHGEYLSDPERIDRLRYKTTPPSGFKNKMEQIYGQVFSIREREAIKGGDLIICFYLDINSGAVTGVEFEIDTQSEQGFVNVPLEKWAEMDKLIMDAKFTFSIPAALKNVNYETSHWFKQEDGNVVRQTEYLYFDLTANVTSEAQMKSDGVYKLTGSAASNGNPGLYTSEPNTFVIYSKSKGFKIYLRQSNYNLDNLAKLRYVTTRDERSFVVASTNSSMYKYYKKLNNNTEAVLKMSKDDAFKWAETMKEKNIILISNTQSGGKHDNWHIRDVWTNKPGEVIPQ